MPRKKSILSRQPPERRSFQPKSEQTCQAKIAQEIYARLEMEDAKLVRSVQQNNTASLPQRQEDFEMLTLFSYPELYGVADNNPYGLKTFAFLKLCHLTFQHRHVFDARHAPRAQLPYLLDDDEVIGDSDAIISYLIKQYDLSIDRELTPSQRDTGLLVRKLLDDLYWVMSYSRWKDPRFWPLFRDKILATHPDVTPAVLEAAQDYNFKRYYYQGIGRYEPDAVYERGVADLAVLGNLLPETGFLFGAAPSSIDASLYGFVANIYYFDIETPLKTFLLFKPNLVTHCCSIQAMISER
jgi:glutathione S-transferase